MKHWTESLNGEVYNRLANCKTRKNDLQYLTNARWLAMKEDGKDSEGWTKEDALICVLELMEANSQIFDLTEDEYNELCKE